MLRHSFGLNDAAAAIEAAVAKAIEAGNRTGDIFNAERNRRAQNRHARNGRRDCGGSLIWTCWK